MFHVFYVFYVSKVPSFGLLISLIGNIATAILQFVFPPLISFSLFEISRKFRVLLWIYCVIGVGGGGYGSYTALRKLIE